MFAHYLGCVLVLQFGLLQACCLRPCGVCLCWVAVLQLLIDELQLQGQITAEEFLKQREEQLDKLFPTAALMPGNC